MVWNICLFAAMLAVFGFAVLTPLSQWLRIVRAIGLAMMATVGSIDRTLGRLTMKVRGEPHSIFAHRHFDSVRGFIRQTYADVGH
ncbi:hypothetical protein [Pararhizobium mangrovi]|uniref:Uncharacterized protein n=1 Tax=Pararhizobium mangrovi TaxID=2590452 RepID=A0A506U8G5_9HYPH|nr:hypothetical protein [Pararhizobium mangrovi]TPW30643.1 hypothetical protein FJU11_04240 [Pararhizobium mangrovi]